MQTMESQVAVVETAVKEKYGDQIEVSYIDVMFSPEIENFPQIISLVMSGRAPLPIIMIDGQPKIAGGISLPMIFKELEQLGLNPIITEE